MDKIEKAQEEYRKEVLNNKDTYPNLYELEIQRNKYKFEQAQIDAGEE